MYLGIMSTAAGDVALSPPDFLELAAHPVRWRLLSALAHSDLRVSELCSRLSLPQSLVSYHVARLRALDVVHGRRSSADGREIYYALDVDRCAALLADSGAALHPGLRLLVAPPEIRGRRGRRRHERTRVLFLCTGNSARSQIAEALVQHLAGGMVEACSAGSHPKALHPNAVRVLLERGIDIEGRSCKHLDKFSGQRFDYVVSLCDRVREVCPEFPGHPDIIHWSIPDPAREGSSDDETYPAFERTAEELAARLPFLLQLIDAYPSRR
jgi:ArsR family transcriptional regulator, arsenate/arsenite/antimonite-responsive transcriptional repressor / arsenate reductase (thioredoxin)